MACRYPTVEVRNECPTRMKLDAGQRTMLVHLVNHQGPVPSIVVVPKPRWRQLAGPVVLGHERGCLGVDNCPPALSLHRTVLSLAARKNISEAGAVGGLVKPVAHGLRPDSNGFEQDVVFGWSRHCRLLPNNQYSVVHALDRSAR